MNAKEAIARIRVLLKENVIFYDDEKREMDEAISVLFRLCGGQAYKLEKCVELKGYWKTLASPGRLEQAPHDSQQLRRWIDQALEALESHPKLED